MDKDDDLPLVARWRKGDPAAFTILVARYQKPLYNAAYRVLGNAEDAADTVQNVFLKVAERLDSYDEGHRFFSWIYRITVNEAIDLFRRSGREEPLDDEIELPDEAAPGPERQYGERQTSDRIQRALLALKVEDRVVLMLRHFSECSYKEIGEILELEEKTVKSRLFEARQRLALLLGDLRPR